jgi:hypothetical protein
MSIQKRFASVACRLHLWFALAILSVSLVVQRQLAQSAANSQSQAYAEHIDQIIAESETLRQQRLDRGALWLGGLHEKVLSKNDAPPPSPSTMTLAGQRRIAIESVPVGSDRQYLLAMEIHECNPGLDACSSGGSIRLTTAAGEPLFSCEMGILLTDPTKPSYYSLLWDEAAESLTHEERQHLLEEIAGEHEQPSAAAFFENLQLAYLYDSHQDGPGKEQALRLWQNVLSAIIADQANSTN